MAGAISRRAIFFAKVGGNTAVEALADERCATVKWLAKTIAGERRALERARRRFVSKPTERRLHGVRTTGRRFRSLLEDVADLVGAGKLHEKVKRAAAITDAARDATIIFRLLDGAVDDAERHLAEPLFEELRAREQGATRFAHQRLRRTRFNG